jgi:CDP-glucose 4,6-dehydratase
MGRRLSGQRPSAAFWRGRRVLLTGHTGFKGAWLAHWLHALGADVTGYALPPEPGCLADRAGADIASVHGDIRDAEAVGAVFERARPEIVLHLAAQALVRRSYAAPVETFATNVMGTVHVLDSARTAPGVKALVIVTSDKCYEPHPKSPPFVEGDRLGGHDPYSASKACAELVAASWQHAFAGSPIATARAGNVIGGGDIAVDRLVPDCLNAWTRGEPVRIRNPDATRPWQHVLDPLCGYLLLAERLAEEGSFAGPWNFGPLEDAAPVRDIVRRLAAAWGAGAEWAIDATDQPSETQLLSVDAAKARSRLGWQSRLTLTEALDWTVAWHRAGGRAAGLLRADISRYEAAR